MIAKIVCRSDRSITKIVCGTRMLRCTANCKDLDGDSDALNRSEEHRQLAVEAYGPEGVCKKYGINSSVIVSQPKAPDTF